jgi:hypothetical protein
MDEFRGKNLVFLTTIIIKLMILNKVQNLGLSLI